MFNTLAAELKIAKERIAQLEGELGAMSRNLDDEFARAKQFEAALIEALDTGRLDTHEKYQRLAGIAYERG